MGKDIFNFKLFSVQQAGCAMKVGTDGVLLGACTPVEDAHRVLDVGTGTGLLTLMLAQRTPETCRLTGIEIDPTAARQAQENVAASPWAHRIEIVAGDFCLYDNPVGFDLVVSNPPYFTHALPPTDHGRRMARHTDTLNMLQLMEGISRVMTASGKAVIIIPQTEVEKALSAAPANGLWLTHRLDICPKEGRPAKRSILTFKRHPQPLQHQQLCICTPTGEYTHEYARLTADFYLHL